MLSGTRAQAAGVAAHRAARRNAASTAFRSRLPAGGA